MPGLGGGPRFFVSAREIKNKQMDTSIPVANIMTRNIVTVTPATPVERIHDLFEQHAFHHIPVLSNGRLVGIISRVDYLKIRHMLAITWGGETICQDLYKKMTAEDIMTPDPLQIEPADTIGLAADIFKSNRLHALPIVENGELVGIVTSHDLLSYAYQENILTEI
jgi:CBS domain-containing protein